MKKDRYQELAEAWLKKARDDLLWVKHDFKGGFYGIVCFGCQQIAEKSLKAYLFSQKEKLTRTHNLMQLLKFSKKYNSNFEELLLPCKKLNRYYTDTRYPDIWDYDRFNDRKLAKEALKLSKKVLDFVKKKTTL